MTEKVDPSPSSDGQAYMIAQAIEQHGAVGSGWIVPDSESYAADHPNSGVSGTPLGAFAKVGESGLDVTFDTGEAFVGGAWLAKDTQTTISLADNTAGQSVVLGWDYDGADDVKIGVPGASPGDTFDALDPRIPLYEFDTDSGAVSAQTDQRTTGKTTNLGASELGGGSEIARFLMTAVTSNAVGSPGDSSNELWRAPGGASDLLMSVRGAGSDRMNLAWNAYYDGSDWRYTTGSENAYRLTFDDDGLVFYSSDGSSASADDVISAWHSTRIDLLGDIVVDGNEVFNHQQREFGQNTLEGPPSSLSGYPLPPADLETGSGSGLDADLLDGQHASEISTAGEWTPITTQRFTDATTGIDYDTGTLSTVYDVYEAELVLENHADADDFLEFHVQVNGDASSNYYTTSIDHKNEVVGSSAKAGWTNIAKTEKGNGSVGTASMRVHTDITGNLSSDRWPVMSCESGGWNQHPQAQFGHMEVDYAEIDRFRVISRVTGRDCTGVFKLKGKNY